MKHVSTITFISYYSSMSCVSCLGSYKFSHFQVNLGYLFEMYLILELALLFMICLHS